MSALDHCMNLQDAVVEHAREWEKLREETEKAIAEQDSMSQERQLLRNVLALEQRLILALEKLLDANQDAINRRKGNFAMRQSYPGLLAGMAQAESKIRTLPPSLEMLGKGA